ncbi:MAG: exported rane protein [Herbinix sp.]|nr:exported rane protein [Herbinix sp.]
MKKLSMEGIFTKPINVLLLSILCTLLWGSAYPSIKTGYELFALPTNDIPGKLLFAGVRFFAAGLITIILCSIQNKRFMLPEVSARRGILLVSLTQTVLEYIFFYISMSNTTGVKGSILNASSSFFVVILAHLFYKNDKITLNKLTGCIIGFMGIIMINQTGLSTSSFTFNFMGDGMMLLAGLAFAVGSLISKKVCQTADAMVVTGYQLGFGGLVLMVIGLITGGQLTRITTSGILLLSYMALLSAMAFSIWTALAKYNKMSKIAVYNFLTPVFGALLSALFLGEALLTFRNILALLLVSAGIGIVNVGKELRK